MFQVIPAIDLINGQVVRLKQGDYNQQTTYSQDPVSVALDFEKQGAQRLHVVDLDAAKQGLPINFPTICKIAEKTNLEIDVGGGIRTEKDLKSYLEAGIRYGVLGSVLLKDSCLAHDLLEKYASQIIIGLDAKNGKVSAQGWTEDSDIDLIDLAQKLEKAGARQVIATDIAKDGMLSGPNLTLYQSLAQNTNLEIIASGGVSSPEDMLALKQIPQVTGAIVGKALYENKTSLAQLIESSR